MKKLSLMIAIMIMIIGTFAWGARHLKGLVTYSGTETGVGDDKPVYVYYTTTEYYTVYTSGSWYDYGFYPPMYFYKVKCRFSVGANVYVGETSIDATLYTDSRYDITVVLEPEE